MADSGLVEYGGFWRRFVAFWVDAFLASLILFPLMGLLGYGPVEDISLRKQVVWSIPFIIAATLFIYYRQATPGKMLMGLRVVDASTLANPGFVQSLGRQVSYILSSVVFSLGFIWIAFDGRKQGWHDKLAGTVVIRRRA